MVDVEDQDLLVIVINRVAHPVLAALGAPLAREGRQEGDAHPERILRQRAKDELDASGGHGFRQAFRQSPSGRWSHDDPRVQR